DNVELGFGPARGDSGFQSGDCGVVVSAQPRLGIPTRPAERSQILRIVGQNARKDEICGKNTDDRHAATTKIYGSAQNAGIGVELLAPECVGENNVGLSARSSVSRGK